MSLIKRFKFGVIENIFDKIVNILFRFLEPILFINFLGVSYYGEWLIIFAIPAYLLISDIGYVVIGINKINMLIERKRNKDANLVANKTFSTIFIFNLIFSLFFFIIFYTLNDLGIFNLTLISKSEFLNCLLIFIIFIFISQLNGFIQRLLACVGYYHLEIRLGYIYRISEITGFAIAMYLGFKATGIAISLLIVNIFFIFVNYFFLKSKTKLFSLQYDLDFTYINENLKKGLFSMAFPIGNAIKNQATLMIIGSIIGPVAVVITNMYLTISRIILLYVNLSDGVMKIELAKMYASKKLEKLKTFFTINLFLTLLISIILFTLLIIFGELILKFWIGNQIPYINNVFNTFVIYGLISCLFISSSNIQHSTNNFIRISKLFIIFNLLYIIILVYLSKEYGLFGVAISFLITEFFLFISALLISMGIIKINFYYILKKFLSFDFIKLLFRKLNFF